MKPRHAAALALLGWYLMAPPVNPKLPEGIDAEAPLSHWSIMGSFDTASECVNLFAIRFKKKQPPTPKGQLNHSLAKSSECIATDDPRLKRKIGQPLTLFNNFISVPINGI
jgi:hypothetical protein